MGIPSSERLPPTNKPAAQYHTKILTIYMRLQSPPGGTAVKRIARAAEFGRGASAGVAFAPVILRPQEEKFGSGLGLFTRTSFLVNIIGKIPQIEFFCSLKCPLSQTFFVPFSVDVHVFIRCIHFGFLVKL
jgi:hypothetical protein